MKPLRYNVRVYGIWINERGEVLLTDERRSGHEMTKFPGGGLDLGEGLADGLRREWMEELELEIEVGELFYINDFLQISAFNPKDQLISIYYYVTADEGALPSLNGAGPEYPYGDEDVQYFRWAPVDNLKKEEFTFPIDRVVVEKLQEKVSG